MVRITGHRDGSTALDCTVNSAVGLPVVTGPARPSIMCFRPWDVIAGPTAATGIREAVRRRGETGEGESISLALSDVGYAAVGILGHIGEAMVNRTERAPIGNDLYGVFGRDFATKDGRRVMVLAITARAVSGGACSTPSAATSPGSFMMPGSPLELRRLSLCVSPGKSTRSADATPGSAGVSPAGGPKDHRCSMQARASVYLRQTSKPSIARIGPEARTTPASGCPRPQAAPAPLFGVAHTAHAGLVEMGEAVSAVPRPVRAGWRLRHVVRVAVFRAFGPVRAGRPRSQGDAPTR